MRTLLLLIVLIILGRVGMSMLVPSPYIFSDELIYLKLAQSLADLGRFELRGEFLNFPSVLYPLLLVPAQWFGNPQLNFKLVQATNIVLASSAAIPLFLLARRLFEPRHALMVALLAVLAPYMLYSNVVMSESLFFPLVMWAAFVTVRALTEEGLRWKLALGVVLGLAFFAKPHGMFLPLAILAAYVAYEVGEWKRRSGVLRRFVQYLPALGIYGAFLLVHLVKTNYFLKTGNLFDLSTFFGTYSSGFSSARPLEMVTFARAFFANLGAIAMGIGFVPFVLFIGYAIRTYLRGTQQERTFVTFVLMLALLLIGVTARHTVTLDDPNRIHERYCFYLEPLFLLGGIHFASLVRLPFRVLGPASLLVVVLSVSFVSQAFNSPFVADTPTYSTLWPLMLVFGVEKTVAIALIAGSAYACVIAWSLSRRRWRIAFAAMLVFSLGLSGLAYRSQVLTSSDYARRLGFVNWIQVHAHSNAPIAFFADNQSFVDMWVAEFFSRQSTRMFYLNGVVDRWNDKPLTQGNNGELVELSDLPEGALIVAHITKSLDLPVVDQRGDVVLYRKVGPVRLAVESQTAGRYPDTWTNGEYEYRATFNLSDTREAVFYCKVDTSSIPLDLAPYLLLITDGTGRRQEMRLPLNEIQTLKVPVHRNPGQPFIIRISSPTWVPAEFSPSKDTRELGFMLKEAWVGLK